MPSEKVNDPVLSRLCKIKLRLMPIAWNDRANRLSPEELALFRDGLDRSRSILANIEALICIILLGVPSPFDEEGLEKLVEDLIAKPLTIRETSHLSEALAHAALASHRRASRLLQSRAIVEWANGRIHGIGGTATEAMRDRIVRENLRMFLRQKPPGDGAKQ